jgi:hypothetical protein
VAIVANFEGEATKLNVPELLQLDLADWKIAIATPNLNLDDLTDITLGNSQGILLLK